MTKEEKIAKIYKKIADKTLSFGCIIKYENELSFYIDSFPKTEGARCFPSPKIYTIENINDLANKDKYIRGLSSMDYNDAHYINYEIIGHPVMIGDVLDYLDIKRIEMQQFENYDENSERPEYGYGPLIQRWINKRKPIEEQSDGCIDYVFNLLPK